MIFYATYTVDVATVLMLMKTISMFAKILSHLEALTHLLTVVNAHLK